MPDVAKIDPWDLRISVLSRGIVGAQLTIDAVMPPQVVAFYGGADGVLEVATATAVNTWARAKSTGRFGDVEKEVAGLDWSDCLQDLRRGYAEATAAGHSTIGQIMGDWMARELQTEMTLGG